MLQYSIYVLQPECASGSAYRQVQYVHDYVHDTAHTSVAVAQQLAAQQTKPCRLLVSATHAPAHSACDDAAPHARAFSAAAHEPPVHVACLHQSMHPLLLPAPRRRRGGGILRRRALRRLSTRDLRTGRVPGHTSSGSHKLCCM